MDVPIAITPLKQFECLYQGHREVALYSGRGAGKSHAVAEYLLMRALQEPIRILCTRETQNSISDSVLKLLSDKISHYKLGDFFDVQRSAIYCKNGSDFIFKGIARHVDSIKSMEKINICWLEEAQTASADSIDILLPTIFRNEGAQVIYTYNPRHATDAVYERFHGEHKPPKSNILEVSAEENPFFSEAMREEMAFDFKRNPDMAAHIWGGELMPDLGSGLIYPVKEKDVICEPFPIPKHFGRVFALDFGWTNQTAALFGAYDRDNDVVYIYSEYYINEKPPSYHANQLYAMGGGSMYGVYDPSGDNKSPKDGKDIVSLYREGGLKYLSKAQNAVEKGLMLVLQRLQEGRLKIFETLANTRREYRMYIRDEKGDVKKQNDHLMDCLRYLVISGLPLARSAIELRSTGGYSSGWDF